MAEELKYKIFDDNNTVQTKQVEEFIELHDNSFEPKISTKVSITDYAEKLCINAKIITCQINTDLVGMCAFYCQPEDYKYAFLSYLAVDDNYRGNGIAKKLISSMIEYCADKSIKGIKTSTWQGNRAISLYTSFGFESIETDNHQRVELILDFEI